MTVKASDRLTAEAALQHPWLDDADVQIEARRLMESQRPPEPANGAQMSPAQPEERAHSPAHNGVDLTEAGTGFYP